MHIIEAKIGRTAWISGVFVDHDLAAQYLDSIPNDLSEYQHLVINSSLLYPFYIVEEKRTFRYLNCSGVEELLGSINKNNDDDHVYFNLYYITGDYQPPSPGIDYMGILNHVHVDNWFLERYSEYGIDLLRRNRMAPTSTEPVDD